MSSIKRVLDEGKMGSVTVTGSALTVVGTWRVDTTPCRPSWIANQRRQHRVGQKTGLHGNQGKGASRDSKCTGATMLEMMGQTDQ